MVQVDVVRLAKVTGFPEAPPVTPEAMLNGASPKTLFSVDRLNPVIVWLAKRHDSPEIDAHGKESLNFQISMLLYTAIAAVFCLVLIGFLVLPILWVLNAVFVIVASIQASDGKLYRYPMTIRFIE